MHKLKVNEKYYNMLKMGTKTIELRLFDKKRQTIKIGDMIEFSNNSNLEDRFSAEVINLHFAEDFASLCQKIEYNKAGFATNESLIKTMKEFYALEKQKEFGVIGIEIKKL